MPKAKSSPLAEFRRRSKQKGMARVEVHVRKEDAEFVRSVARALVDPLRRDETRTLIKQRVSSSTSLGLKALLAAAPLDDNDLDRSDDKGREMEL